MTEMDEFTMSAFPRYPDGSRGEAFAEVFARTLVTCFGAMAAEVSRWLPSELERAGDGARPKAIELTFRWSGQSAAGVAPQAPDAPRAGCEQAEPPAGPEIRRSVSRGPSCSARRSPGWPARARPRAPGAAAAA